MRVIMFQPQFKDLVSYGSKKQTIRRKARCKPGDLVSLRIWEGKPYRSKQYIIAAAICVSVKAVTLEFNREGRLIIHLNGKIVRNREAFAKADGFESIEAMALWFIRTHGPDTFHGEVIEWGYLKS